MASNLAESSSLARGKRKAGASLTAARKAILLGTPCFYDPTSLSPTLHELYSEKAYRLFVRPDYRVDIAPTDSEAVLNYFESRHAGTAGVVRVDGRLQLCYGVLDPTSLRFEWGSRFLSLPQANQTCIIFVARFKAVLYQMSDLDEGDYRTIATRFHFEPRLQERTASTVARYTLLFKARTDDTIGAFPWSEGPEPAQIAESSSWLQDTIFPQEIITRFALSDIGVIPNDATFRVHDSKFSIDVRGKTDALLVHCGPGTILAVIQLKKRVSLAQDLRHSVLQLYAAARGRCDSYAMFGVLTDLDSYWYIVWFDTDDETGIDLPCYFLFRLRAPAIRCIRALTCSNMKANRSDMPKPVVFNGDDDTFDDSAAEGKDADDALRDARRAWKKTVRLRSTQEFQTNQTNDTQAHIQYPDPLVGDEESLDMELYKKLADEGFWKWRPDLSELPDADDRTRQQEQLANAFADLAGMSRNDLMADAYERIQENRRHEEERAREASRLASERLKRLQRVGVYRSDEYARAEKPG